MRSLEDSGMIFITERDKQNTDKNHVDHGVFL
jgi:hypothetical protein